ncbi:MAG: fasciclin domain-containing protein [Notoacmeibacter sp.]|nr:fasciclin domain-containing protein [Notoacmeibacter sp.]
MLRRICAVVLLVFAGQLAAGAGAAAEPADTAASEETTPAPEAGLPSVLEILRSTPRFGLFGNLIRLAGEPEIFSDGGPMTVFVPPDAALIAQFNEYMAGAEGENYQKRLKKLVLSHVLREQYSLEDMRYNITMTGGRNHMQTVSADALTLRMADDNVVVFDERNNAVAIVSSITAKDGVIHELDGSMLQAR